MSACSVNNCDRAVKAKSLCNQHYMRKRRHGDPLAGQPELPPNEPGDHCIVGGCSRLRKTRNWCEPHYQKHLKYGDANVVIHRQFSCAEDVWNFYMPGDPPPAGVVWPWTGPKHQRFGYGVMYFAGTSCLAHRFSYERYIDKIPEGLLVRHNNDIPVDVNPHNLLVGTHQDNANDKVARGRQSRGNYRLEIEDYEKIHNERLAGESALSISKRYEVDVSYIHRILRKYRNGPYSALR